MSPDQDLSAFSLFDLFRMEAEAQARALTDGLLALERGAGPGALEPLMRAAHSIKGAAAIVGLDPAVQLAHAMEDALLALSHQQAVPSGRIDALLAGVDLLLGLAKVDEAQAQDWLAANEAAIEHAIGAIARGEAPGATPVPGTAPAAPLPPVPPAPADTADELLALASQSRLQARQLQPWIDSLHRYKRSQAGMLALIEQLHEAAAAHGDPRLLALSSAALSQAQPLKGVLLRHIAEAEQYERNASTVSTRLVDEVLALRMCHFGDGTRAFARLVRDLARSLGKQARLEITGDTTLVDRTVLPRIENALNQVLRNALDHGLEMPDERVAAGKPAEGVIRIDARHRGGMLVISIADDGRGVDSERIRAAAVRHRRATPAIAAALSDAELMEFLFLPGFSLKESANELSGRGVGLDVVHELAVALNGSLRAQSQPGQGFGLVLTLPLTQSIVRALIVEVQGEPYALPIARVERVLKLPQAALSTLGGNQFFELDGQHVGVVAAAQVLALGAPEPADELALVVIGSGRERHALAVDAILGEQSLTAQPLEPVFGTLRDIAAGALLDDGAPVLILDLPSLLVSIGKLLSEGALQRVDQPRGNKAGVRRILVVDDSLTVREMERKLLAARGYHVDVALDGMDGWNMLRSADYDLLVSDIDMPRMDGIELVTLVRADPRLQRMPVMIVSYKDRPEDRARGLQAGADYYLAKGSFHDSALLDAVSDLIGPPWR
ncbi:response regulator [Massilia agilis]|uniref:histidine kinase n=1 Tax=Massilia agilis TaxID=1811226 RepID=A0ABT2DAV8_9BURK|nr:response regulator [Massilia agilis]MCS0808449.1 response regulator [Massilia agilis]